ncbi:MAG: hypothetical protein Q8Q48_00685 [Candidatus Staskawiczbacteria bacterium]|nr:hypothetical protein [Candidatus Staskawiczbacteria bacterium]
MAVVFISPKQRQKTFFLGITIIFLLFLAVVASVVFLSQPKTVARELVFNKPKVNVDISVFDSDQFKNLQLFTEMQMQFKYSATTKENKTVTGLVSALSKEDAIKVLTDAGLMVLRVEENEIGRENPFTPY